MPDFDLIIADSDGTLINDDRVLSELTIATIRRVRRDFGVNVLLASSRMPRSIRPIQEQLGCLDTIVALDGALVVTECADDAKCIIDRRLGADASARIVGMALDAGVHVGIFRGDEWVVSRLDSWTYREIRGNKLWPVVGPLQEYLERWARQRLPPHKIMIRGKADDLRCLREAMREYEGEVILSYGRPTAIEVVSATAGKWRAVQLVLDRFSIRPERVLAFGDSDNDFELLRSVGHGVAPNNATDRVRQIAREITLSNTEDGMAAVLAKYFPAPRRRPA